MTPQERSLAIAWTVLCAAAVGSMIVAAVAKMYPLAFVQLLVSASTDYMARTRKWEE